VSESDAKGGNCWLVGPCIVLDVISCCLTPTRYSTGSNLNTYSALIQNFYTQECAPHQAVHITMNTGTVEGEESGVKAYISSPVGVFPKPENCVFIPIPVSMKFNEAEKSGLDLLTSPNSPITPSPSLDTLSLKLNEVLQMIERVLVYVRRVLSGEVEGDKAIGKYLLDTLNQSTPGLEGKEGSGSFGVHVQDTLMMNYLSSLVRSQVEVSQRLAMVV